MAAEPLETWSFCTNDRTLKLGAEKKKASQALGIFRLFSKWTTGQEKWTNQRLEQFHRKSQFWQPRRAWRGLWLVPEEQLRGPQHGALQPGCCIFASGPSNLDVTPEEHRNYKDDFILNPPWELDRKLRMSHDSRGAPEADAATFDLFVPSSMWSLLLSLSLCLCFFLTSAVLPSGHLLSAAFVSWRSWCPYQVTGSGWDQWETLSPPLSSCWAPRSLAHSLAQLLRLSPQRMENGLGGDGGCSFGQMDDCHWWELLSAQVSLAWFTGF